MADLELAPPDTDISVMAFFDRFTTIEKLAIATLAQSSAGIFMGIIHALSRSLVDLTSAETLQWVNGLQAAGVLTADRVTEITTP
jgi:hypothetical protein